MIIDLMRLKRLNDGQSEPERHIYFQPDLICHFGFPQIRRSLDVQQDEAANTQRLHIRQFFCISKHRCSKALAHHYRWKNL